LRFKWKGRPSRIQIYLFPKIGIAQAREWALAHRRELENGIDPRRAPRPGVKQSIRADGAPQAKADGRAENTSETSITLYENAKAAEPLLIPKPTDDDKHSVYFLVYEFVEFYVTPSREVPQEVIRILKKDVLPYFEKGMPVPSPRARSPIASMPSWREVPPSWRTAQRPSFRKCLPSGYTARLS